MKRWAFVLKKRAISYLIRSSFCIILYCMLVSAPISLHSWISMINCPVWFRTVAREYHTNFIMVLMMTSRSVMICLCCLECLFPHSKSQNKPWHKNSREQFLQWQHGLTIVLHPSLQGFFTKHLVEIQKIVRCCTREQQYSFKKGSNTERGRENCSDCLKLAKQLGIGSNEMTITGFVKMLTKTLL